MSKYPLLNIYRAVALVLAVLLIIVGIIVALRTATASSYDSSFDLGIFIATLFPFLVYAFGLGVAAELILLLLQIADDVQHIRDRTDSLAARSAASEPSKPSSPAPQPSAPLYEPTARVRAKSTTTIRAKPDSEASASSQLMTGQSLPIYGRTSDSAWFTISRQGSLWLDAADVEIIEGYLSNLSVMEPA